MSATGPTITQNASEAVKPSFDFWREVRRPNEMSPILLKFYAATIPCYVALAYPLSWAATTSLHHTFGLTIDVWDFMKITISPYPYWYFS